MIKAAVVGLGVGAAHARAYATTPGASLVRVFDIDETRRRACEAEYRLPATSSFNAILEDPDVEMISIASYDDAHGEEVLAALAAGKHLLVEKPLARSMEELRLIKSAWIAAGRPLLASNLVLRAAPLYLWLKESIARGDFGEIYAFDGDYLYGRLHKITEGWRKDVADYSVLQGGGIHLIDLMLWLTGQRPSSAWACGTRIATRGTDYRYDDYTAATWKFPSGLVGRVTANYGCVHPHQHELRIFGTKATFLLDDMGPRVHRGRDAAPRRESIALASVPDHKGALVPELIAALGEEKSTEATTLHEMNLLAACFAADRSAAAGVEIPVEIV